MRQAARAIIIKDNNLLVMHRNKFGEEYDTLPGGNVELQETIEQALYREVKEETGIEFDEPRLVFIEHAGHPYGQQYIYLCNYISGEPALSPDSEEEHINKMGQNLYQPKWLSLNDLNDAKFLSESLKRQILWAVERGWPKETLEFNS